ncbi:hypothetical protein TARUN_3029 [Trichoderma arundinaceum]|uniref:HNH nuclease domain-containing protein n=1 Tax=Trichoderma arundinaceum TaxID=490622 RepID=A0A395NT92_TRIAR|nr:hypothetical protein TARUN_3029 [Trichoderma arundinaceum]
MSAVSPAVSPDRLEPPALVIAKAELQQSQCISLQLQGTYAMLKRREPEPEPDQQRPEPDLEQRRELVCLGLEVALREKKTIRLERNVLEEEMAAGLVSSTAEFTKRSDTLDKRHISAGDEYWRNHKKKMSLDGTGVIRYFDPRHLALYADNDGLTMRKSRPSNWRRDCIAYYDAERKDVEVAKSQKTEKWCHVSGMWHDDSLHKAAPIVPFFIDFEVIGEMLFGDRSESLSKVGNSLSLSSIIKGWFDKYLIVIVPVDATETPIRRWRTDIISKDILNSPYGTGLYGRDLDRKELVFRNEKRPVSRFLYFHFIISLIRIRHIKRPGWEVAWAQYYDQRLFPSPGNYMRQSMLIALATHYETADMKVIESWISDHSFEEPLPMAKEEIDEAARRVHKAVNDSIARAEERDGSEDESEEGSEDESEDESSEDWESGDED